jgi:hypothetical protein
MYLAGRKIYKDVLTQVFACNDKVPTMVCTLDESYLTSVLKTECDQIGGKAITLNFRVGCSVNANTGAGVEAVLFNLENINYCVGNSCSISDLYTMANLGLEQ